jgi:hypothetical protein
MSVELVEMAQQRQSVELQLPMAVVAVVVHTINLTLRVAAQAEVEQVAADQTQVEQTQPTEPQIAAQAGAAVMQTQTMQDQTAQMAVQEL